MIKKTLKLLFILLLLGAAFPIFAQNNSYTYQVVSHDDLSVKQYTMKNGMKVYMSVYKDVPRIQTYIAVRVGSKNDPAETTGLAHYLEHLMFKGTNQIGTLNWQDEEPLLQQIEQQFERYRAETNPQQRAAIYHIIDSLSYLASTLAVPNEYVKMMKFIGSTGTNAWTSNDNTVYVENIPSNQLENWAMIQGNRFQNPVIRLFHTELETVYEEKNRSLTNDSRKAREAMLAALFPDHPYGTQTTLGRADHLKNPSITHIKNFIETYYVPNNMAIVLAGDFNPDEAVATLEKYFGNWQPRPLPAPLSPANPNNFVPQTVEVAGQEAAFVQIAFRIGKPANAAEIYLLRMLDHILNNGKCGLIDLNINQKQLLASASSAPMVLCDNSAFVLTGKPKSDQTLEEVQQLLLQQIEIIKKGDFDDALMSSALNNMRLREMRQAESATNRASQMLSAFTNQMDWAEACRATEIYEKITKEDIQKFVQQYFTDENRVVVYKRQAAPEEVETVAKPAITPIFIHRDAESDYFKMLKTKHVETIAPVYVDYQKAIQTTMARQVPIYCVKNVENETFSLNINFPVGELTDRTIPVAATYINMVGTALHTPEAIRQQFYQLACSFSVRCSDDELSISLSGLSENFEPAYTLLTELLLFAQSDEKVFAGMIENRIKSMEDAKKSQDNVLSALRVYGEYGTELVHYSFSPEELRALSGTKVLQSLQKVLNYCPTVRYYGTQSPKQLRKVLLKHNIFPKTFAEIPKSQLFDNREVVSNEVLFVPYNAKQSRLVTYSRGPRLDTAMLPYITLYNSYFGGGMDAIVFQEMREKRSLAYTARSAYVIPTDTAAFTYNYSFIGTQNDKVIEAWTAFNELFNQMPISLSAFELAKENVKTNIATTRYTKGKILSSYFANLKKGYHYDYRKDIYEKVSQLTMEDVVDFNEKYIKNQPKVYMILARENEIDAELLQKNFGVVKKLTLKDVFGY